MCPMFEAINNQKVTGYVRSDVANILDGNGVMSPMTSCMTLAKSGSLSLSFLGRNNYMFFIGLFSVLHEITCVKDLSQYMACIVHQ